MQVRNTSFRKTKSISLIFNLSDSPSPQRTFRQVMKWCLFWRPSTGPSRPPQRSLRSTCWGTATSQECCLPTAAKATCPLSGHSPHLATCPTAAARGRSSKGVSPSEWPAPGSVSLGPRWGASSPPSSPWRWPSSWGPRAGGTLWAVPRASHFTEDLGPTPGGSLSHLLGEDTEMAHSTWEDPDGQVCYAFSLVGGRGDRKHPSV